MRTAPSKSNTTAKTVNKAISYCKTEAKTQKGTQATGKKIKCLPTLNEYTRVSSATGSRLTTDTAADIKCILKEAKNHNIYVVVADWKGNNLTLDGVFFGDDATKAGHSVMDNVNNRTVNYYLKKVSSKKNVKDFVKESMKSVGATIYIVQASQDSHPKYKFIALDSALSTDTIREVTCDVLDSLYYISTGKICVDFISAGMVA